MSKPELNPAPSWRTLTPTQLRMLAQLQKRDFVVLGGIVAALVALSIWGIFRATPPTHPSPQPFMVFTLLAIPLVVVAAIWPLGVWRQDSPARRGYFWSLPAPRGPHTLLRVAAGWGLLMIACVGVMLVTWLLLLGAQLRLGAAELSLARWYVPLATATLAYLIVSSLAVAFDGPVRVLVWTCVAVIGLRLVAEIERFDGLRAVIHTVVASLGKALAGPLGPHGPEVVVNSRPYTVALSVWGDNYLIWLALSVAALLLVAYRYREAK